MRRPIIAGNWKMNMSTADAEHFVEAIKESLSDVYPEVILCPPFTLLADLKKITAETPIQVGAQNMHFAESGAYTGEISALMLKELEVDCVIIGHSERRQYYNETDSAVNSKVLKALEQSITPIFCCGETLEQRESGEMKNILGEQVRKGLADVSEELMTTLVIAYEPVWAIGTGKVATSAQANDAIVFIRSVVQELAGNAAGEEVRIIYGGSVTPGNIKELMENPDIDGALVGGASLKPESYQALVENC